MENPEENTMSSDTENGDPPFGTASGFGYGQYPIGDPLNPHNPVPWPPDYTPPPPIDNIITTLNYNYQTGGGQPPNGYCYQDTNANISINNNDNDGNDNTAFLQTLVAGDTIMVNGITWTIVSITPKGSNVMFGVDSKQTAMPEGVTSVMFDQAMSKAHLKAKGGKK
jgi:hypothetical protein